MGQTPELEPVCHLAPKLKKKLIILVCEDLLYSERPGQLCLLGGKWKKVVPLGGAIRIKYPPWRKIVKGIPPCCLFCGLVS